MLKNKDADELKRALNTIRAQKIDGQTQAFADSIEIELNRRSENN